MLVSITGSGVEYYFLYNTCTNGANNYPDCNICASGTNLVGEQCVCTNGASNSPTCTQCGDGLTINNNLCVCANGASNTSTSTPGTISSGLLTPGYWLDTAPKVGGYSQGATVSGNVTKLLNSADKQVNLTMYCRVGSGAGVQQAQFWLKDKNDNDIFISDKVACKTPSSYYFTQSSGCNVGSCYRDVYNFNLPALGAPYSVKTIGLGNNGYGANAYIFDAYLYVEEYGDVQVGGGICDICPAGASMQNNRCVCTNGAEANSNCSVCPVGKAMYNNICVNGCSLTNVCGQAVTGVTQNGQCVAPSGTNINSSCITSFNSSADSVSPNGTVEFSWKVGNLPANIGSRCGFVDLTSPTPRPIPGLQNLDPNINKARITNIQTTTRFCLICQFYNLVSNASLGDAAVHQWVRVIRIGEE
jgi:hypothetical protein